jgi:hypothetical protein
MANTGYKSFTLLERYYKDDDTPTGETKPNVITDSDYIAPVLDTMSCPPGARYYNTELTKTASKNNCSAGQSGTDVTLTAYANQFVSNLNLTDANNQALAWLNENVQSYANNLGTCRLNTLTFPATQSVIFEKQASSWEDCRNASIADSQYYNNNLFGSGTSASVYYLSRYRGTIDTSEITTKPLSAKIKFKFSNNTVGSALTINLFASNTKIPINLAFQLSDWNDWDSTSFISSVGVPINSTAYNEISLTPTQINLLYTEQTYNFFLISNADKTGAGAGPTTNNRPELSILGSTGEVYLECKF